MTDVYSLNDPTQRSVGFAKAKEALAANGLVVMPTDTVYGLAADAFDPVAVRRLLRAKGRGRNMPAPVLIGSADTLRALATNVSAEVRELTAALWPGALTLICRQQPTLRWDIGDSRGTVALRVPDHADAVDLLLDNGPLAVSSANLSGMPPATTVEAAQEMLGESVDVYLDAGPTPGPTPSTIVDATDQVLRVMRIGVISLQRLREIVPTIEGPEDADEPDTYEGFASPEELEPTGTGALPTAGGATAVGFDPGDSECSDDEAGPVPPHDDEAPMPLSPHDDEADSTPKPD